MQSAKIKWENGQAVSEVFGDVYFSRQGGLEESKYVFLSLNNLEERFASAAQFQIGELGFGTGLNFLLSWKLWLEKAPAGTRLNFVSTELFPMCADDMRAALSNWPELQVFSEELIRSLPLLIEGVHRLQFAGGRVCLTLLYGEAFTTLSQLEIVNNKFDCWFLDGFSPQKNPQMWQAGLIRLMSKFTKPGGSCSTFSVAGLLRRALTDSGWSVEKVPGFLNKRESLKAEFIAEKNDGKIYQNVQPWFSLKNLSKPTSKKVTIIGAGLAGCWSAYCLAQKGFEVCLIDRATKIASEASGNLAALALPYLSPDKNLRHRFYLAAFEYCRRELEKLERTGKSFEKQAIGARHYLPEARVNSLSEKFEQFSIPPEIAKKFEDDSLFYSRACVLSPALLCRELINSYPGQIEVLLEKEAISLVHDGELWEVNSASKMLISKTEILVIANSCDAESFPQASWLPLANVRGELVLVEDLKPKFKLPSALSKTGYILPLRENKFLIGASYNRTYLDPEPSSEISLKLFEQSQNEFGLFSQSAKILSSRVAFRASTYDRLPYLGPLANLSNCMQAYKDYQKGFAASRFPDCEYLPGLYLNVGHGSRGVVSSPLCAEILASMICSEPLPLESDLIDRLLPTRWLIRELGRGHIPQLASKTKEIHVT